MQRQSYPHGSFWSRLEAYPSLAHSGRLYSAAWEREHWAWDAVLAYLADGSRQTVTLRQDPLYHGKMYVGAVNRGKEVVVQFDAETAEWVISDPSGVELCRRRLDQFNEASLRRLPIA